MYSVCTSTSKDTLNVLTPLDIQCTCTCTYMYMYVYACVSTKGVIMIIYSVVCTIHVCIYIVHVLQCTCLYILYSFRVLPVVSMRQSPWEHSCPSVSTSVVPLSNSWTTSCSECARGSARRGVPCHSHTTRESAWQWLVSIS